MREMPVGHHIVVTDNDTGRGMVESSALHSSSLGGDLIEQGVGLLCYDAKGTSYIVVNTPKTSI